MEKLYFDYASGTPMLDTVRINYFKNLERFWHNSSSIHSFGQKSKNALEQSRQKASQTIGAKSSQIFFASNATITNNLVINNFVDNKASIIVYNFEHASVLKPIQQGFHTILEIDETGIVNIDEIIEKITDKTQLICLMLVNNVIGTIQPIQELSKKLKEVNLIRAQKNLPKVLLFCDASNAFNYLNCDVEKLSVDFMTISSSKIYGPHGIALLYARDISILKPIFFGGYQESGLFSGTQNVPAIIGMIEAMEIANKNRNIHNENLKKLNFKITNFCRENKLKIIGDSPKAYGIVTIAIDNFNQETLLTALDLQGIAVGAGSACSSGSLLQNEFIKNLGSSIIRISISHLSTDSEVDELLSKLVKVLGF